VLAAGMVAALGAGVAFAAAPGSPRAQAEALIAEVDAHPADKKLAAELVDHARSALGRANGARSAGDVAHGEELEAMGLEWAQAARDLVQTTQVEEQAVKLEKQAADASRKAIRAQALLEETLARRGRAEAKLKQLEQTPPAEPSHGKAKEKPHHHEHKAEKHAASRGKP
jgi:hypothetical protein